jgi:hypothetical protein
MDNDPRRIIAYETHPQDDMPIEPAPVERAWMDESIQRFAYRCLPLAIANRAGWIIRNPTTFVAVWNGGLTRNDTQVNFNPSQETFESYQTYTTITLNTPAKPSEPLKPPDLRISSHFGSGVVTFSIPYLFRTPKGINLWVKGPTNQIKDGAQALEGIVETDWLTATFTMNWKLTRPRMPVTFKAGEPICMIVPIPRGLAEGLDAVRTPMTSDPELHSEFKDWERSRSQFMVDLDQRGSAANKRGWQKHYFKGETLGGKPVEEHQTRVDLPPFRRVERVEPKP